MFFEVKSDVVVKMVAGIAFMKPDDGHIAIVAEAGDAHDFSFKEEKYAIVSDVSVIVGSGARAGTHLIVIVGVFPFFIDDDKVVRLAKIFDEGFYFGGGFLHFVFGFDDGLLAFHVLLQRNQFDGRVLPDGISPVQASTEIVVDRGTPEVWLQVTAFFHQVQSVHLIFAQITVHLVEFDVEVFTVYDQVTHVVFY